MSQPKFDPTIIGVIVIGAVAIFGIMLIFIIGTGSTFGQRCAKLYPDRGADWKQCVTELNKGVANGA